MLEGTSILIAEDSEELLEVYESWVTEKGASAVPTMDGEDALDLWTEEIDIVVLDRILNTVRGDEVLAHGRSQNLDTPVVLITAIKPDIELTHLLFDEYLQKPVKRENFLGAIKRVHPYTGDIRLTVRRLDRISVKIRELRKQYTEQALYTHSEYRQLVAEYNDSMDRVMTDQPSISPVEREILLEAVCRVSVS